jgi:hypothetical protein
MSPGFHFLLYYSHCLDLKVFTVTGGFHFLVPFSLFGFEIFTLTGSDFALSDIKIIQLAKSQHHSSPFLVDRRFTAIGVPYSGRRSWLGLHRLGCGSQMRAPEAAGLGLGLGEAEPSGLELGGAEYTGSELGKKTEMA